MYLYICFFFLYLYNLILGKKIKILKELNLLVLISYYYRQVLNINIMNAMNQWLSLRQLDKKLLNHKKM